MTVDDERFLSDLRAQLLDAAERPAGDPHPGRGRRMVQLGAAAVVLMAVAIGVLVVRTHGRAAADVDVIVDGKDLIVRLNDVETRPQAIIEAARGAGLDVRIRQVPVGPSNVGKFIASTASIPGDFRPIDRAGDSFTGFRISRDWPGTLELELGRPARTGEAWVAASDALDPEEVLACEPLLGESVGSASTQLVDRKVSVRWVMLPTPGTVAGPDGYGSWRVVQVQATGPRDVSVFATADVEWPFPVARPKPPSSC
mgnify:CR=1 FL=1